MLLSAVPAEAQPVDPIYEAVVPVAARSDAQRLKALGGALDQVLGRLLSPVARSDAGQSLRQNPSRYVREYRYTEADSGTMLRVSFDPYAVNQALRQEKITLWDGGRPDILVWLVVDQGGKRQFFRRETLPELDAALVAAAQTRGLRLMRPLLDLSDQRNLAAEDVVVGDRERIVSASARYEVSDILTGYLRKPGSGAWEVHWSLLHGDAAIAWQGTHQALKEALEAAMGEVYGQMFGRYASVPPGADEASGIGLRVEGINDLLDFARVAQYLAGLETVTVVDWRQIKPGEAEFRLQLQASSETLRQALAMDALLQAVDSSVNPMVFRVLP